VSSNMAQRKSVKTEALIGKWSTNGEIYVATMDSQVTEFLLPPVTWFQENILVRTPYQIQFEISPWSFTMFYYPEVIWSYEAAFPSYGYA
jgi:hypothetical protein